MSKQALQELLAKVEKRAFKWNYWETPPLPQRLMGKVEDAYDGSLDAAKALHESVLSDEWAALLADWGSQNEWTVQLSAHLFEPIEVGHKDPARAWLCAILKALIAQEGE